MLILIQFLITVVCAAEASELNNADITFQMKWMNSTTDVGNFTGTAILNATGEEYQAEIDIENGTATFFAIDTPVEEPDVPVNTPLKFRLVKAGSPNPVFPEINTNGGEVRTPMQVADASVNVIVSVYDILGRLIDRREYRAFEEVKRGDQHIYDSVDLLPF